MSSSSLPFMLLFIWHIAWQPILYWSVGVQFFLMSPFLAFAAIKHRVNPAQILISMPFTLYTRIFNSYYTLRAMVVELVLVPLGFSRGMTVFIKGGR